MGYYYGLIPYSCRTEWDTSYWTALSEDEGIPTTYGNYKLSWKIISKKNAYNSYYAEKIAVLVIEHNSKTEEYEYGFNGLVKNNKILHKHILSLIEAENKTFIKERARTQALERKERNQKEAEELGISVKELIEKRKAARAEAKVEKSMAKTAEQLERLFKVGGHLKRLKEDIEYLEEVINKQPSKLEIKQTNNYLVRLHKARQVLRRWSGRSGNITFDI